MNEKSLGIMTSSEIIEAVKEKYSQVVKDPLMEKPGFKNTEFFLNQ